MYLTTRLPPTLSPSMPGAGQPAWMERAVSQLPEGLCDGAKSLPASSVCSSLIGGLLGLQGNEGGRRDRAET